MKVQLVHQGRRGEQKQLKHIHRRNLLIIPVHVQLIHHSYPSLVLVNYPHMECEYYQKCHENYPNYSGFQYPLVERYYH